MIPFADVRSSFDAVQPALAAAVAEILATGQVVQGARVRRFEEAFAAYCGARFAVAVASGTDALELTLRALDVRPGDEVITTPLTFFATAEALLAVGARPVFVDVDPDTLQLDPARVEAALTPRTVGLLPVHLHGAPVDAGPLVQLALDRGLWLVEDAAQAHGARLDGVRVGSLGVAGCFSFYPGKNLGTCGEGGAVVTREPALAERLRRLRDHGSVEKYHHVEAGKNARMSEIEAAALELKLPLLDGWNAQRRAVAARYDEGLADLPLERPRCVAGAEPVWHLYVVRTPERDALRAFLGERGVQTGLHYPLPLHLQPALANAVPAGASFPHAERAAASVLSLPMFPGMTAAQVEAVCDAVADFFRQPAGSRARASARGASAAPAAAGGAAA